MPKETKVKRKKNKMGFTEKQLKILLNYCKAALREPRITYRAVHKRLTKYVRLDSTIALLKKAYEREVITGPFLYANTGVEVSFMNDIDDPLGYLRECKKDPKIIQAYALHGDWKFIQFKKGANTLQYVDSVLPHKVSNGYHIEDLTFEEKGKLPTDPYPHGWSDKHWKLFEVMSSPRKVKLIDIVKKTGIAYETIVKYFDDILKQSKIHACFFPLSKMGYSHQVVTFKTDYEIGVLNALKELDRTNYIYKTEGVIILVLNIIPKPSDFNNSTDTFKKLEEKGYIRDVHICTPRKWFQR
ncbi:MAG: hypothetical protein PVF58_22150 [Candidatus Methanofastidiosia archaeon]|jgi:hypothetical protein